VNAEAIERIALEMTLAVVILMIWIYVRDHPARLAVM